MFRRCAPAPICARLTAVVATAAALLVLAHPAAAAPDQSPVRFWSVSKLVRGVGLLPVDGGAQSGGKLEKAARVGRVVFNLPLHAPYWYFLPRDAAFGALSSSANGVQYSVLAQAPAPGSVPIRPGAPDGAITHLDEYQAYVKQDERASLRITLSDLLLQTVDDNNDFGAFECASPGNCDPVRAVVRFHARAYAASAGGDFYDTGGVAYLEGHQHSWRPGAATSADSPGPLWGESDFDVDGDVDDSGTGAAGLMAINKSLRLKVPLAGLRRGELFAVHVTLEAEAVNELGGESASQAFIQDPQHGGTGLLQRAWAQAAWKATLQGAEADAATPSALSCGAASPCRDAPVRQCVVRRQRGERRPVRAGQPPGRVARRHRRHRSHQSGLRPCRK